MILGERNEFSLDLLEYKVSLETRYAVQRHSPCTSSLQDRCHESRQLMSQATFAFAELSDEQKQRVKVNLIFSRE